MGELEVIQSKIYEIRGCRVMLDRDLAELYQVTTGNLNKAVKRNIERFPNLKVIDRFAPSSKRCNVCGHIYKKLALSERTWICSECGTHLDRDLNAAINIKQYGINALPVERRKVKAVECPTMDDRSERNLRSSGMRKQQKKGDIVPRSSSL